MSRHTTGVDQRCRRCWLAPERCLCAQVPTIQTSRLKVLLLRHQRERHKGSNSARLVKLCMPSCELRDYGLYKQPMSTEGLDRPGLALLYPADEGDLRADPAQVTTLVVLDGTWTQARKMSRRIPGLAHLPRLDIGPQTQERVRMRRSPNPGRVSTAEAVAAALDLIEGPGTGDPLLRLFELQVQRVWQARGSIGGVPWRAGMVDCPKGHLQGQVDEGDR